MTAGERSSAMENCSVAPRCSPSEAMTGNALPRCVVCSDSAPAPV